MIAGLDGCEDGWMAACQSAAGDIQLRFVERAEDLLESTGARMLVIDIPIGLLDRSPRGADVAARRLLKGRSSCVFNAPIRPILSAESYSEANRIWREVEGKGCSAQGFALVPKLMEIDELVRRRSGNGVRFVEGHPEVSFAMMNGEAAVPVSKHSPVGLKMRCDLLAHAFGCDIGELVARQPRSTRTDAVDALALLWTARRIDSDEASRFPSAIVERDQFGIEAVIIA